jgi:electron transfer flavoprotein beta subunit
VPRVKIAVCVKAVPDAATGLRIDPATRRLDRSGDLALSPFDLHPVEEALRLREPSGEGEVVVVSVGPAGAADAIRKTLAMGVDRSVLVTDEELAGSDLIGTAHALAGALGREEADLVLFGQQSADGDGACLWAAVAELLGCPVISQVAELSVEGGSVTGRRQTEHGYERIRAPLPAVVAVSDAINEPRYPSLKGIMGAKSKPQETLHAAEVGGPHAAGTSVIGLSAPPSRGERRRVEGAGAAEAILEFLVERRLL